MPTESCSGVKLDPVSGVFDCRVQRYYVEGMIAAGRRRFGSSMFDVRFTSTIPSGSSVCHFDMFAKSDEAIGDAGLGLFPQKVSALPPTDRLPHMGWNQLRRVRPSALLEGVPQDAYFYFAHSYAALDAGEAAVALCDHSASFVAVLEQGNVFATQFHPEKSGPAGAQVLSNFVRRAGKKQ